MKWTSVLVVLGLVGCGFPQVDPESPRLQVTPVLRQACEGDTDVRLSQDLFLAEVDRLSGITWTEQTVDVSFFCLNDDACAVCLQAIIDQVYGI